MSAKERGEAGYMGDMCATQQHQAQCTHWHDYCCGAPMHVPLHCPPTTPPTTYHMCVDLAPQCVDCTHGQLLTSIMQCRCKLSTGQRIGQLRDKPSHVCWVAVHGAALFVYLHYFTCDECFILNTLLPGAALCALRGMFHMQLDKVCIVVLYIMVHHGTSWYIMVHHGTSWNIMTLPHTPHKPHTAAPQHICAKHHHTHHTHQPDHSKHIPVL